MAGRFPISWQRWRRQFESAQQLHQLLLRVLQLLSALPVHGEKVPVQGFVECDIFLHRRQGDILRVPEDFVEKRLELRFADGEEGAGLGAVFDLAGAGPLAVLVPAEVHAAVLEHLVGRLPAFLVHDGRNDLAGLILEHKKFLRWEEFLLFSEQGNDLVAHRAALVLGRLRSCRTWWRGRFFAVVVAAALFPEGSFDLLHGVRSSGVKGEQLPHHGALVLLKMICRNCYWQMCCAGEMEQFYWQKGLFCLLQTYLRA